MSNVRMPIETYREGDKITKVCVEDAYKVLNRVISALDNCYNKSMEIIDKVYKEYGEVCGNLIIGKGTSEPCGGDVFDDTIGNNIAFMKAKLNAGIKKHNILCQIWNELEKAEYEIDKDLLKIDNYIKMDLEGVRKYNENYLPELEDELGL